jgi:hypothetical protein
MGRGQKERKLKAAQYTMWIGFCQQKREILCAGRGSRVAELAGAQEVRCEQSL